MIDKNRQVGRRRIFSDEKQINKDNVVQVLAKAFPKHCANVFDMDFLIDYEAGVHPAIRDRVKGIRQTVDYKVVDNIAHYVTRFKTGYFWGSDAIYIQRGNNEIHDTNGLEDNRGIAGLNEMLINGEDISRKRQAIASFVERVGVGYSIVDVKTADDFNEPIMNADGIYIDSPCHIYDLDSRTTFIVYHNGVGQKELLGVVYVIREDGAKVFTCYTADTIYEIENAEVVSDAPNPFGMIPIVEWERSTARAGCFEHCIEDMDSLDVLVSDAANDSTQRTQDIWWGHNIELPPDENGKIKAPDSGEWVLTYTPQGMDGKSSDAKIAPLASTYDSASAQSQIYRKFNHILQKCFVPVQSETTGGGSTGSAMDMSSGWSAMELDALSEEATIRHAMRKELRLILKAIQFVPKDILPVDNPVRKLHHTDIDTHFPRRRNYDLSVKANAFSTLIGHGVHPRHALKVCEIFSDNEQVWNDSKDMILAYQEKVCVAQETSEAEDATEKAFGSDDRIMQDLSDQVSNSPRLTAGV